MKGKTLNYGIITLKLLFKVNQKLWLGKTEKVILKELHKNQNGNCRILGFFYSVTKYTYNAALLRIIYFRSSG